MLLGAALFVGGFFWFVQSIEPHTQRFSLKADGIVALTGGTFRISEADRLLEAGLGKRLLISGVNQRTTRKEVKKLMPKSAPYFDCCVDIDRKALNTVGNADETGKWVRRHGFRSLIIVTSSYHMPRSLIELRRVMPDVKLIPYSVRPKNFHLDNWWQYPRSAKLLASEYVKFVAAAGRLAFCRATSGLF